MKKCINLPAGCEEASVKIDGGAGEVQGVLIPDDPPVPPAEAGVGLVVVVVVLVSLAVVVVVVVGLSLNKFSIVSIADFAEQMLS